MWQSLPFKISQPEKATCRNPPLTKLTSQILPRHHLLHLTHETLTLIFLLSYHHHGSHRPPFTPSVRWPPPTCSSFMSSPRWPPPTYSSFTPPPRRPPPIYSRPRVLLPRALAMAAPSNRQSRQPPRTPWPTTIHGYHHRNAAATITTKHPPFAQLPSSP